MPNSTARLVAALAAEVEESTDAELLARFAAHRDAGAFELVVWRHAGLVLHTCRGVLGDHHAAEDATQAVFLALARQAESVGRTGSAAGWLFRVARRVATRAVRRQPLQTIPGISLEDLPAPDPSFAQDPDRDRVLHEELARLPEQYRAPVLLCFFEGLTHAQAARHLGWPVGTVAGRVARAKDRLATRLVRRGVTLALPTPVAVAVSPSFAASTSHAAVAFARNGPAQAGAAVLGLARQELRMTVIKKVLAVAAAVTVACGCLAFGVRAGAEPPVAPAPRPAPDDKTPAQKPVPAVIEKSFAVVPITTELQRLFYRGGPNSTVVVILDGSAVFKAPKTLDVEALGLTELRKGLVMNRPDKGKSVAHFEVHYARLDDADADAKAVLDFTLEGVARATGFVPGTAAGLHTYHNGPFAFKDYVAPLKDDRGAGDAENGLGDARVKAYPVRTPLSRLLTQSAGGVVDVRARLDCRADDWIPGEVSQSVAAAIKDLRLEKGQRLNFQLNIPERDLKTQGRVRGACKRWAEEAGLESGAFSY